MTDTKKIRNTAVNEHWQQEIAFENYAGTLVGVSNPNHILRGELDEREIARLRVDVDNNGIRYVVLSYGTPIAWRTRDGAWTYVVEQWLGPDSESHKGLLQ